jgi:hypothetical protein
MRLLLILISLTFFGCTEEASWENLEKIYFFENKPNDFEFIKEDELVHLPEIKELQLDVVKNRLKKSKYEGENYIWKGGSFYGIAVFSEGEKRKLKMSSNYGIYQDMKSGKYYSIEGFETLGSMNWRSLVEKK